MPSGIRGQMTHQAKLMPLKKLVCYFWDSNQSMYFRHELKKVEEILYVHVTVEFPGKISAQSHTIVKQICFPKNNVLFMSLFSLSKNWMHNVVWGCAEILPFSE